MRAFRTSLLPVLAVLAFACAGRSPRDVDNGNPRSVFADGPGSTVSRDAGAAAPARVVASPTPAGRKPEVIATVDSRALAVDAERIYLGDGSDDALVARSRTDPKAANIRLSRRAPMQGALSVDRRTQTQTIAWIPNPGDAVLRLAAGGPTASTIRDRGIFTHVVASDGDVLVTEVQGDGGVLTRITGNTAARLATFEGTPRGLAVDEASAFIATSSRLVSAPRARGDLVEIARGIGFGSPQVDATWVYATAAAGTTRTRIIVRAKKAGGGPLETIATGVRDASLVLDRGTLYWFDIARPALLAMPTTKATAARVVSEDPLFDHVQALAIEGDDAYVATGTGEAARLVRIRLR